MLPDRVSSPGPLTYESGALPIALCGPASKLVLYALCKPNVLSIQTPKTTDFPFGTNGKSVVLGVLMFKHIMV